MLDDLKFINQRDHQDMLGVAQRQPQQLLLDLHVSLPKYDVQNIIIAGMGGSQLAGEILLNWPSIKRPIILHRDYGLPAFADSGSLCIITSHSGNTEEALSAFQAAQKATCKIIVISSGGKLQQAATHANLPHVLVPGGLPPRMAVWHMLRAQLEILITQDLIDPNALQKLTAAVTFLSAESKNWHADRPRKQNLAKQLAETIAGKTPVIYAQQGFSSAAYKWKINFNETAKNIAFHNTLPEFNHNEMLGWTAQPVEKPFTPIFLRSQTESQEAKKRYEHTLKLLSGRMPSHIEITAHGQNKIEELLWLILLGDFVGIYLACLNGVNPADIQLLERLKSELNDS